MSCLSFRTGNLALTLSIRFVYFVKIETNCLRLKLTVLPNNKREQSPVQTLSLYIVFISLRRLSPLGHVVWVGDTTSDFQTGCLIMRQAVQFWDKLSDLETSRPSLRQVVWLLCNLSSFELSVILHSKPQEVCYASSHLSRTLCIKCSYLQFMTSSMHATS